MSSHVHFIRCLAFDFIRSISPPMKVGMVLAGLALLIVLIPRTAAGQQGNPPQQTQAPVAPAAGPSTQVPTPIALSTPAGVGQLGVGQGNTGSISVLVTKYPGQPDKDPGFQTDPVNEQLKKRVEDSTSYLNALITLMSVIVVVLTGGLTVSMWFLRRLAVATINEHFATKLKGFGEELEPIISDTKKQLAGSVKTLVEERSQELGRQQRQLDAAYSRYLESLRESFRVMWTSFSEAAKQQDAQRVDTEALSPEKKEVRLRELAAERRRQYAETFFGASLFSQNVEVAIDAAQQLGALGGQEALPVLLEAQERWLSTPSVRAQIETAIDEIRRKSGA